MCGNIRVFFCMWITIWSQTVHVLRFDCVLKYMHIHIAPETGIFWVLLNISLRKMSLIRQLSVTYLLKLITPRNITLNKQRLIPHTIEHLFKYQIGKKCRLVGQIQYLLMIVSSCKILNICWNKCSVNVFDIFLLTNQRSWDSSPLLQNKYCFYMHILAHFSKLCWVLNLGKRLIAFTGILSWMRISQIKSSILNVLHLVILIFI